MRLWGLTGGIASGKSTVNKMLAAMGVALIDADAIYHELLRPQDAKPSPLTHAIAAQFEGVLHADGALNRRALAQIVFADADARRRLEAVAHPAVANAAQAQMVQWARRGAPHAVYDVPLLFERGMQDQFAGVILVWVPLALQIERLKARDGLNDAQAFLRIQAQQPLDNKRAAARWIIDNSGPRSATEAQLKTIWQQIENPDTL